MSLKAALQLEGDDKCTNGENGEGKVVSEVSENEGKESEAVEEEADSPQPEKKTSKLAMDLPCDKLIVTLVKKALRHYRDCHRARAVAASQFTLANIHLYASVVSV